MSLEVRYVEGRRTFRFLLRPLLARPAPDSMFAPDSVIRRVFSDTALLGSGRALLLQLAHPKVAQGVYDHSDFAGAPFDRLFGTFHAMSTVVYGSPRQIDQIRAGVHRAHTRVNGPDYDALDPSLLRWVNATLCEAAVSMYERIVRPLSRAELDEFYADARLVAEVFGCPVGEQPATAAEFERYWEEALESLHVTPVAREISQSLLSGVGMPMRPAWLPPLAVARCLTAATLPDRIRREYALPLGPPEKAVAELVLGTAEAVLPRVPHDLRQLGAQLFRSPDSTTTAGHDRADRSSLEEAG